MHQIRTGILLIQLLRWTGVDKGKFYDWKKRRGELNKHNANLPRLHYILDEEREAVLAYHDAHPFVGYRALSYMMLDADVAAISPSSVYRILRGAGVIDKTAKQAGGKKGKGFIQPTYPHEHWHVDVAYLNILGTFYYLCMVLDGYSRKIVSWDIAESMKEEDIERVIEKARKMYPKVKPRIISDNGPQFLAKDFKKYIKFCGMTHVRTSLQAATSGYRLIQRESLDVYLPRRQTFNAPVRRFTQLWNLWRLCCYLFAIKSFRQKFA